MKKGWAMPEGLVWSQLGKAIWGALIVFVTHAGDPVGTKWCRPDCAAQSQEMAALIESVAQEHSLDPWLLAALAHNESAFNPDAFGIVGEVGSFQVHPRSKYGRGAVKACNAEPKRCDYWRAWWGAQSVADGFRECGDEHGAIGFHKTGKCKRGPAGRRILAHKREMERVYRREQRSSETRVAQAGRERPAVQRGGGAP